MLSTLPTFKPLIVTVLDLDNPPILAYSTLKVREPGSNKFCPFRKLKPQIEIPIIITAIIPVFNSLDIDRRFKTKLLIIFVRSR